MGGGCGGGGGRQQQQTRRTLEDGYEAGKSEEPYGVGQMWEF